mgnify:CR=1 FL=1
MRNKPDSDQKPAGWKRPIFRWAIETVVLFGLWLSLSGHFEPEFIAMGALAAVAAVAASEWLFAGTHEGLYLPAPPSYQWLARTILRFLFYLPWLAWEVLRSNIHVALLVLHPKLPVTPTLVEFESSLGSERGQVLLAQSITLTPGTVTVDVTNGKFLVHCLSTQSREGLADGSIQRMIANLFEESAPSRVTLHDVTTVDQALR